METLSSLAYEPPELDRVREHSAPSVNQKLDRQTADCVQYYSRQGHDAIVRHIAELDQEWDIDRALMVNFAVVGGAAFTAGVRGKKGWLYFFGTQIAFLFLHGTAGWCPPASLFRRLGFRTQKEIDAERRALERLLNAERDTNTKTQIAS